MFPNIQRHVRVKGSPPFFTESEVTSVIAVVHGILMDIPVPFPLPNPNACTTPDSGIQCPLSKGGTYQYKTTLPVLKSYPKVM